MAESVATIRKNQREEIRVALDEYQGRSIFSARVWFVGDDDQMRPGKSGIAFKAELLPAFAEAVAKALARAKEGGLCK